MLCFHLNADGDRTENSDPLITDPQQMEIVKKLSSFFPRRLSLPDYGMMASERL